jgi:ATP-dependent DNA ligase
MLTRERLPPEIHSIPRRQVRLYCGCGNEWTGGLPALAAAMAGIPCGSAILDGEQLILAGAGGAPDFVGLHLRGMRRRRHELVVRTFDILHRDGRDLRALPLSDPELDRRLDAGKSIRRQQTITSGSISTIPVCSLT